MFNYMKKNIFFIVIFIVLNGCAQFSSFLGPAYTIAKTGNIAMASASAATSYGIKKTTGYTPAEHIKTLVKNKPFLNEEENLNECQTIHSLSLNEIFFETLYEIDCFRDTSSIHK